MAWLLAVGALAPIAGCWEEIHYDPSRDVAARASPEPEDSFVAAPDELGGSDASPESPVPAAGESTTASTAESPPAAPQSEQNTPAVTADELFDLDPNGATGSSTTPPERTETAERTEPPNVSGPVADIPAAQLPEQAAEPVSAADRLNAWTAASQWSLAAAMQARQAIAAQVQPVVKKAEAAAAALGVTLPPIPEGGLDPASGALSQSAAPLLAQIAERCSSAEGAAARLAVESHAWLLHYTPLNPPAAEELTEIRAAATASQLPAELTDPLLTLVTERAEFGDVKRAIFAMHREVAAHLQKLATDSR